MVFYIKYNFSGVWRKERTLAEAFVSVGYYRSFMLFRQKNVVWQHGTKFKLIKVTSLLVAPLEEKFHSNTIPANEKIRQRHP